RVGRGDLRQDQGRRKQPVAGGAVRGGAARRSGDQRGPDRRHASRPQQAPQHVLLARLVFRAPVVRPSHIPQRHGTRPAPRHQGRGSMKAVLASSTVAAIMLFGLASCVYPPPPPPPPASPVPPPPYAAPMPPPPPPPVAMRHCPPGMHWVRAHRMPNGRWVRGH